tara:strand:- start:2847 stop:3224 length:378 start_codon:yes stop_codon:yes gene_type:complete
MTNKKWASKLPKDLAKKLEKLPRIYKRGSQKGKILLKLLWKREDGGNGKVLTLDLNKIGFRYPSRIHEMRNDGWNITTERVKFQEQYYELEDTQAEALAALLRHPEAQEAYFVYSYGESKGGYDL